MSGNISNKPNKSFKHQWRRRATWLMPGLYIKRWISLVVTGVFCVLLGMALYLNLHPISFTIDLLKRFVPYFPAHTSGPVLMFAGFVLLYFGTQKAYFKVFTALSPEGGDSDILESLYRKNKLDRGPEVVAIGGGTGLSTLLRGLKRYTNNITAVVTVGDDGGSSGRLREEQGIIPPGDIRNCIAALADEEQLITSLFQYRFQNGQGLEGHSFGNLFLTAMCQISGDMISAIRESSKVLNIRGRVLPATLDNICLVAEMEDGSVIRGESQIPKAMKRIQKLTCDPANPKPLPDAVKSIEHADLILMGPGSLYTSILPNLIIPEIAAAISSSTAPKVYIANIMTQPGETDGFSVADHVQTILEHTPYPNMIDCVIVNRNLPEALLDKYLKANYKQVALDSERCKALGVQLIERTLVDEAETQIIRHNPKKLARAIIHWFKNEHKKTARPSKKVLSPAAKPATSPTEADKLLHL